MLTRRKRKQRDRLNEKADLRIGYNSRETEPLVSLGSNPSGGTLKTESVTLKNSEPGPVFYLK